VIQEGRLLYVHRGSLLARRFDARSLALGDPEVVAEGVYDNDFGNFLFTAAGGTLAYGTEDRASRLVWFDRSGKELGVVGTPADYVHVELSPSGSVALLEKRDAQSNDLYLLDLAAETFSRFTFGGGTFSAPVFSPDGTTVAYCDNVAPVSVYLKPLAGTGAAVRVATSLFPSSFTPDGKTLLGECWGPESKADIGAVTLGVDEKPRPLLKSRAWENDAHLSPDGRWLAYHSDESGTEQVYVQDYPAGTSKWQISAGTGWNPRWRADGREILYVNSAGICSVEVAPGSQFAARTPKLLLRLRVKNYKNRYGYALTKDGSRFLVNVDPPPPPLTLLLGWTGTLKR
jgi:dipeptidyl aminopeptidase/acylaminoacyl peptidase